MNKDKVLDQVNDTVLSMVTIMKSLDQNMINIVPYENSWTAGQLFWHVYASTKGVAQVLQIPTKPSGREAEERVEDLKKIFMDFSTKMKSPEFINPAVKEYNKEDSIAKFESAYQLLNDAAASANMDELVQNLPFGDVTKYELLNFVLFHTQRHYHQLQKIEKALKEGDR